MCQPPPKSCAFCSHSIALVQCAMRNACCPGLDKAPGSTCTARAAIAVLRQLHFSNFPCYRQAAVVFWQQGSGRKEYSCKWCIVLLRACCVIFAAQGRNIPANPSVLSALSIKSPSSSASFFTVYFAALVQGMNCRCLFCHSLQFSRNPPFFPGKGQPPPGRQSCLAAVLHSQYNAARNPASYRAGRGTKEQSLNLHSQKGTKKAR